MDQIIDSKQWKIRGDDYVKKEQYEEAIKCYEEAIILDPENLPAWNNIGYSLFKMGKKEEAKKIKEKINEIKTKIKKEEDAITKIFEEKKVELTQELLLKLPKSFNLNAYHILGLNTSSDTNAIQKRGKEIINRLKIDDFPNYEQDFIPSNLFRDEKGIREAIQKFSTPKNILNEMFFWFNFENENETAIITAIKMKNLHFFSEMKQEHVNNNREFERKKNLAISYSILLFNKDLKPYLNSTLVLWNEIINSDEFWDSLLKNLKMKFDFTLKDESFRNAKKEILLNLSNLFAEIAQENNDADFIKEFQKLFSLKGKKVEKEVISPILDKIFLIIEELNSIMKTDFSLERKIVQQIDNSIKNLQVEFNKFHQFGLYNDSEVIFTRDKAVETIREVAIKINNEWNDQKKALDLIKIAKDLAGTDSLKKKLDQDIIKINEIRRDNLLIGPIDELIHKKDFSGALSQIDRLLTSENRSLRDGLTSRKKICVTAIAVEIYNKAMKKVAAKNYTQSKPDFEQIVDILSKNLELFSFDRNGFNNLLNDINRHVNNAISQKSYYQLDGLRTELINLAKRDFKGQYEEDFIIVFIDAYIYLILINRNVFTQYTSSCFVVTATMGNRNHPNVIFLQHFRNDWLVKRWWGIQINLLYEIIGPLLSNLIKHSFVLQKLSQVLIVQPGVQITKKILKEN